MRCSAKPGSLGVDDGGKFEAVLSVGFFDQVALLKGLQAGIQVLEVELAEFGELCPIESSIEDAVVVGIGKRDPVYVAVVAAEVRAEVDLPRAIVDGRRRVDASRLPSGHECEERNG
jgi:hypothetical protein